MTKNLTEGSTLRLIVLFALPLLLGNLFQQTYNMVDSAIVGRFLGSEALAAVGCTGSIQFFICGFCIGVCTGFTIPIAQRFGASDFTNMRRYIFAGVLSLLVFSTVIAVVCAVFSTGILKLMGTPENIFSSARIYLVIIFLGIPFSMMYNILAGILRAVGDSKTPFYFLIVSTVLNIGLDFLFVLILKTGVAGAALATIIAQFLSALLCFIYIRQKFEVLHLEKEDRVWEWSKCRNLFAMGLPMGLQFSITAIGSMVTQAANNSLGSMYVSAFTAGTKLKQLVMCPCDALGTAVSTYCSQNYGAGKVSNIKKGVIEGGLLGFGYGIIASLILVFLGRTLSLMFISSSEVMVLDLAGHYTLYMGLFYWCIGILNVLRPTVQGLGFSNRAIFSGVFEMIARCTVCFGFLSKFKFNAVCAADPAAWLSAVLYIVPTSIWAVRRIEKEFSVKKVRA